MIPKIIHYCWLSGDEFPPLIQKCMQTWKENLHRWEFRLWDKSCLEEIDEPWVHEAYKAKVYSHASDYIRLYAIYKYGGFYLDTDVEVLKDFSSLLSLDYVFCLENAHGDFIEAATFGAEKGNPFLLKCMDMYHGRHFILEDGSYDYAFMIPKVMKQTLENFILIDDTREFKSANTVMQVFPACYFSPKNCDTSKFDKLTEDTYSIHHFRGSWFPIKMRINRFVWKHLGNKQAHFVQNSYWRLKKILLGNYR